MPVLCTGLPALGTCTRHQLPAWLQLFKGPARLCHVFPEALVATGQCLALIPRPPGPQARGGSEDARRRRQVTRVGIRKSGGFEMGFVPSVEPGLLARMRPGCVLHV